MQASPSVDGGITNQDVVARSEPVRAKENPPEREDEILQPSKAAAPVPPLTRPAASPLLPMSLDQGFGSIDASTSPQETPFPAQPPKPPLAVAGPPQPPAPIPPAALPSSTPQVIQLPDVRIFDQITQPSPISSQGKADRRIEPQTEEPRELDSPASAIAQIKKYLYQEEYDLCTRDLARIRERFPRNAEIQAFVENTSKRLAELQRLKKFEVQARELMASAVAFYQEGKREESLIAVRDILRVNPNHVQAREFVGFVERHRGRGRGKQPPIRNVRTCRSCGSEVDAVSQFCYRCGKRL